MECDICLMQWDCNKYIPRLLSCGHTFCEECLKAMLDKANRDKVEFKCPTCNSIQNIKEIDDINKLIKNYNLLRVIEKIESRRDTINPNISFINSNESNYDNMGSSFLDDSIFQFKPEINIKESIQTKSLSKKFNLEIPESKSQQSMNFEPKNITEIFSLDFEGKCKEHDLPYTCYAPGTYKLFCDICLNNTNLKTFPLPAIIGRLLFLEKSYTYILCYDQQDKHFHSK